MFSLLSLVGGGLGGLLRFVPEIFKLINAKNDQKHELAMSKLQLEVDQARSKQDIDKIHAQGQENEISASQAAFVETIKAQGQLTGVKWIDGLNSSVRPMVTYYFLFVYGVYKATVIYDAWYISTSAKEFGDRMWTDNDWATLSMILSFWFVDRVFRKHAEQ